MRILEVNLADRSYPIHIGQGLLCQVGAKLQNNGYSHKALIISQKPVYELYGKKLVESLAAAGFKSSLAFLPDGEQAKTMDVLESLYDEAINFDLDRRSPVIALGGGVVGDVAGFFAATYMRGVPFIQVPTTLLAQVDSSVGGKVAVNHRQAKNLIGAFYQPDFVIADLDTLKSLPVREYKSGLAEVIKYGVIWDEAFFEYLKEHRQDLLSYEPGSLKQVVAQCCAIKATVVEKDERDAGLRQILNFGHTLGHALETYTNYGSWLHGEAVAMGMVAVGDIATNLGIMHPAENLRLLELIGEYGLPTRFPPEIPRADLVKLATHDKKAVQNKLTLILPERIGKVITYRCDPEELLNIWA
ncbi:MAG: 3-dehydroquinate synthase [Bacillota bacterium]